MQNSFLKTKKEKVVESIGGVEVSDPYRWLENGDSSEVKYWVNNQNSHTNAHLRNSQFEFFLKELEQSYYTVSFSNPVPVNGLYFYTERQPKEDQHVLYMKKGLDGTPVKLVDTNGKQKGNTLTLGQWKPSKSGKHLIYGLSQGGTEMETLFIRDTKKNADLTESIPFCRHTSMAWLRDDSAFFYTRNPMPGTVPKGEETLHKKVYLHKLGTDPVKDELIFGEGRVKEDSMSLSISPDEKYLIINVSNNWTENEIHLYEISQKKIIPFIVGMPAIFSAICLNEKVLLVTNHQANNSRILQSSYDEMFSPVDQWEECISETDCAIERVRVTKDKILVEYFRNVASEVVVFDHEGNQTGLLPLPQHASLTGISSRLEEEEFFFGITTFILPKVLYRYDVITKEYVVYRKADNPIDPSEYLVTQEWYTSKDATKIPMFIIRRKGASLNRKTPTVLYGYGGFGHIISPGFLQNRIPWVTCGGVLAIANIRGGGEFGKKWHEDGIKEKKQNSYDDFISAAEYLIAKGYTDSDHLGLFGGSNGGLLVTAVAVQRPELTSAVCASVPLTDMVRFPKFGVAIRWIHEYGDPRVKEDLERILKWSPCHNVKEGVEYPAMLITTGEKDSRVDPLHSRKMVALLQAVNIKNPVYLYSEMDAGHGAGKPVHKIVEGSALVLAFFAEKLGLKV